MGLQENNRYSSANDLDDCGDCKLRDTPLIFPESDHSDGRDFTGRYMVLNGSAYDAVDNTGRFGVMESRRFDTMVAEQCLEVWTNINSKQQNRSVLEF